MGKTFVFSNKLTELDVELYRRGTNRNPEAAHEKRNKDRTTFTMVENPQNNKSD
jgi:hypothetical protein